MEDLRDDGGVEDVPSPQLAYLLIPLYENLDEKETATALRVQVTLYEDSDVETALSRLVSIYERKGKDLCIFDSKLVQAHDSIGRLDVVYHVGRDLGGVKLLHWEFTRPPKGDVVVTYDALPRIVDRDTQPSPPSDLRQAFAGLSSMGEGFLFGPNDDYVYDISVAWDLSNCPPGTSAVWSWGDGPGSIICQTTFRELCDTSFMVGNISSYAKDGLGLYCLGEFPVDIEALGSDACSVLKFMLQFFVDDIDEATAYDSQRYRIFFRYNPYSDSMGGIANGANGRSFTVTYDDSELASPRPPKAWRRILCHEFVHNWVTLSDSKVVDNWYDEGLAEFYSLVFCHSVNGMSDEDFRLTLNRLLTDYYTSPLVGQSIQEVAVSAVKHPYGSQIPYRRGLAFALKLDGLIRAHHSTGRYNPLNSIDRPIVKLVFMQRYDGLGGLAEFLEEVGNNIPGGQKQAKQLYDDMASGALIVPREDSLGHMGLKFVRQDAPIWELGFDFWAAKSEKIIRNLVPGSAAARCNLQEGDTILDDLFLNDQKQDANMSLYLRIRRDDKAHSVSFVPRGEQLVERWQYVYSTEENDSI
ncbi:hypothetical protein BJ166DRAFT_492947 [Pestalotiopsis sp. NC0098]|nr:hypothetical protein BJ166DRAFT_492947 [Pestalotiopsis sp. NC0098]